MIEMTTLKKSPEFITETTELIEKSLGYNSENSFSVDFAPLFNPSNFQNCFILLEEGEVIAHIGTRESVIQIQNSTFPLMMYGGIVVKETKRGQGYFEQLFSEVLNKKASGITFHLLWSHLEKVYNKFGFYLCGSQYEISSQKGSKNFTQTKYKDLTSNDKKDIQHLYLSSFSSSYTTIERDEESWRSIEDVQSADLFIKRDKKNKKISDYFFMNKGEDLQGVIYEYGSTRSFEKLMEDLRSYGKVWIGEKNVELGISHYQFFLRPGDTKLFQDFVCKLTHNEINLRQLDGKNNKTYFEHKGQLHIHETENFLRGILGPQTYQEINLKPFFISGLDSI